MTKNEKSAKEETIFTPKRNVKYFFIKLAALILSAMIIWPLLDLAFKGFDTASYTWTWKNGIVEPIVFGIIFTSIEFACWNFFHKSK